MIPKGDGIVSPHDGRPKRRGAAGKVWDHWVVWDIDPDTAEISEGSVPGEAAEGKTDFGETEHGGPNSSDREHTYLFRLYVLDAVLDLPEKTPARERACG